jgi:hypothetical protein
MAAGLGETLAQLTRAVETTNYARVPLDPRS